ncbi:MAG: pyridoxal phosphate-dependent aminotransferase [Candidatus Eisenbacteria bacterium]|nr:pyridoxal phosphate-dependent aminotransferase [Candidatus Eisenbacteria bacterium]
MTRPTLEHIAWSKTQPQRFRHVLSDSAVAAPDLAALGLPHQADLPPDGDAAQADLERALGARLGAPGGRVMLTAGASEANACAFAGLLEPGEEALVELPGYEPHRAVPPFFGVVVHGFTRERVHGYARVAQAVEAALRPATRLVMLTDLHNPSGAPLADEDAGALAALAERRDLWLVCDETFRDASDRACGTLAARHPRWVTTSTLTKAYGLGSLRIGWVAGSAEALARCANAQNALSVEPSRASVALALALTPHLDTLRARSRRILAENHAGWRALAGRAAGFDPGPAPRGTTAFCAFPGPAGGDAFAALAAERFDLAVVPGRFFGDPRGVRVALGSEPARFAAAVEVFEQAVAAFAATRATAEAPARDAAAPRTGSRP